VTIDDGVMGETWSSLIPPGRPIPDDSTAVHGITNEMAAQAPPAAASAAELRRRCADRTLVFHNATFDLPFIEIFLRDAAAPELWNPVVDTLGLARGLSGDGSRSLVALAVRFGLTPETSHRAPATRARPRACSSCSPRPGSGSETPGRSPSWRR